MPNGKREVFNHAHSSLHNVIERSFIVFKQKWRILRDLPSYEMRTQTKIINACMTLHNHIRDSQLCDKEFDKCDRDENYIPGGERTIQIMGDNVPVSLDEGNMNDIRDRIANSLISATRR